MTRGNHNSQDILKRVETIFEHNQEGMRTLANEELAAKRRNEPRLIRESRRFIRKMKRKLGLERSGTVQVSY
jgi:hypothetical protein